MNITSLKLICEGLIKSENTKRAIELLNRWHGNDNIVFKEESPGNITCEIYNTNLSELKHIIKAANSIGWFPSGVNVYDHYGWYAFGDKTLQELGRRGRGEIRLQAKYDVPEDISNYKKFYHITPQKYASKIQKIGLVPKSKNKIATHPPRIYVLKKYASVDMLFNSIKFYPSETSFVVFEIDVQKLMDKNIQFYADPAFLGYALYTLSNISPDCISVNKILKR